VSLGKYETTASPHCNLLTRVAFAREYIDDLRQLRISRKHGVKEIVEEDLALAARWTYSSFETGSQILPLRPWRLPDRFQ